ncbi:MAG: bifunctional methylenetetrahydrofolate dehydrogenase/methenyltetrahydrofolate cyclohydrolase FolD [Myxococcota bacterium]|nr:bifunctional methylenetetrahydrofolate dehydrogenase/methenyltetrahydrofolate cyclohydrolase FolD [Myxococcota bacterium]
MAFELDFHSLEQAITRTNARPGILDGRVLKAALLEQLGRAVALLEEQQIHPTIAVVQVGDDPASTVYVRNKIRACEKIGLTSLEHKLSEETTAPELFAILRQLNNDPAVHGILLQLPLPAHLDPNEAILVIDPDKDVDGFHPDNLGRLMAWRGTLEPCTPRGVMTMLRAYGVDFAGLDAVVIGRSMTVGRPMAQMLMRANTSVTVCHRHTRDLAGHVARADLLVVATGVPHLVKGDWIKEGATVVDVGISRAEDGSLVGDVEFERARERARWITPVPGGVGQMTVATLMENTIRAACKAHGVTLDMRDPAG